MSGLHIVTHGCSNSELAESEDDFVRTVFNYFKAWKITANTDPKTGISYHDVEINNRWGKDKVTQKRAACTLRCSMSSCSSRLWACSTYYKLSGLDKDSTDEEIKHS